MGWPLQSFWKQWRGQLASNGKKIIRSAVGFVDLMSSTEFNLINKNNTMKKTFPHKIAAMKSQEGSASHATLASTLKAIVSSELKLDKKPHDDSEKSLSRTGSISKLSAVTKGTKGPVNVTNNSSAFRNEESLKVLRKIAKQEISKEKQIPSRIKNLGKEEFRDMVLDSIQHLQKQVADMRSQMYQSASTDNRTNCSISKPMGSCGSIEDTWTEVFLASSSQIINPSKTITKSAIEKRLTLLEDSLAEDKETLRKEFNKKLLEVDFQNQSYLKELNQRLFLTESQQLGMRSDLESLKGYFPISKSHLIDKLDKEIFEMKSRLSVIQSHEKKLQVKKEVPVIPAYIQISNTEELLSCRKDYQQLRKQIVQMKVDLKASSQQINSLYDQIDKFSNVQSDLKELLIKLQARLGVKALADKLVDIEEHVSQYSEYFEGFDQRISKTGRQAEETAYKVCQLESKIEQQPKHTDCQVTYLQFQEALQTLQTQQDNKLMRIITEYNQNFLTIDQSICDVKDFIQQVLLINRTITQKLESVWRNHLNGKQQLDQLYKTSDDVYTLLENNIQRICELSKKELCFEHEVKELKEKIEVVDTGARRRIGSFNASFSDMKSSKLITDIKENMLPTNCRRSGIFNARPPAMSLMDENIHDQSGSFG